MMRRFALLLLFCLSLSALAQESPLRLSIGVEAPTIYDYEGHVGEIVQFSATAIDAGENTPDLVLWIVYNERVLAYNDNQPDSLNPSITLTLPADGFYQIYLDSFNGVSEGEAELKIEVLERFQLGEDENSLLVNLAAGQIFHHELMVEGSVTISAKDLSGGLDPYIQLFNSVGELVGENDDHASYDFSLSLFDSVLSLELPNDTYTLEVRDFLGRTGQLEIQWRSE